MIATPVIIGVIGKTERQAFERSIDGLLETVRLDYSTDSFVSPREYYYEGKDLILLTVAEETKDESVGMKGKIEGKGFIYIDEDGAIYIENICSKKYCASGEENKIEITENESGVIPEVGKNDPIIRLIGEKTIYVNLNEVYEELGAVAKTKSGKGLEYTKEIMISAVGEIVSEIDTSIENTYVITYKTEHVGKEASVTRTVVVLDMKPEITMTDSDETAVTSKEVLITVSGIRPNQVTEFTYEIKVNGVTIQTKTVTGVAGKGLTETILLETDGMNEVIVTATDNNNHTNTMTKTYRIDKTGPVITIVPKEVRLESENVLEYNLFTGVSVRDEVEGEIENSRIEIGGDVLLKIPGRYEVTYTVRDNLENETTETRTFIVEDKTKPEITITPEETTGYVKSQVVKIEASDNIRVDEIKYVIIKNNTRGTEQTITNGGSITLNETGIYQIEVTAKDSSNNTSSKTSKTYRIDAIIPTLTITTSNYRGQYGTNKELSDFYDANFGGMNGKVVCKNGTIPIDNINKVTQAGEYSIKCTAIGNNGKSSAEKTITMTITPKEFTEVMIGSDIATNDPGNNKRYVGANPNNYVWFNNEKWRIIGMFGQNIKIIRAEPIGTNAWDKGSSAGGTHGTWGYADWTQATLKEELEKYYKTIDRTSKEYVKENYRWSLTGWDTADITRDVMYEKERNGKVYGSRPTYINGPIGLMYPSDYAYATSETDSKCNNTTLYYWNQATPCNTENWLFGSTYHNWTLTPSTHNTAHVFYIGGYSGVVRSEGTNWNAVETTPVIFLKPTVKVMGGTGTSDDPYLLGYGLYDDECTKVTRTIAGKSITGCMLENDPGNNLRYVGKNPSNYVSFNNELWRIIGVFDGQIKLIRSSSLYNGIAWDKGSGAGGTHGTWGYANWTQATLKEELETYYATMDSTSKGYVNNTYRWSLTGWDTADITRNVMYEKERNGKVYGSRPAYINGPIGLMYPSDYAYATSEMDSKCDSTTLYNWHQASPCNTENWFFGINYHNWTLTPSTHNTAHAFYIGGSGAVRNEATSWNEVEATPVVFLKQTIKIKSGSGTHTDPYILGQ